MISLYWCLILPLWLPGHYRLLPFLRWERGKEFRHILFPRRWILAPRRWTSTCLKMLPLSFWRLFLSVCKLFRSSGRGAPIRTPWRTVLWDPRFAVSVAWAPDVTKMDFSTELSGVWGKVQTLGAPVEPLPSLRAQ